MTAKPDDSSPHTDQGRREFLRTGSIIAGGMLLSQTVSSAQAQATTQVGIPLDTLAKDFPLLTPQEINMMTPAAQVLTKADLITLSRVQSNREELDAELALNLTANDLNSLEQAFANYGVGRFQALQIDSVAPACCCCSCTPCCSCCASSVVKPVRVL